MIERLGYWGTERLRDSKEVSWKTRTFWRCRDDHSVGSLVTKKCRWLDGDLIHNDLQSAGDGTLVVSCNL